VGLSDAQRAALEDVLRVVAEFEVGPYVARRESIDDRLFDAIARDASRRVAFALPAHPELAPLANDPALLAEVDELMPRAVRAAVARAFRQQKP
jgi:hypothetical protein